MAHRKQPSPRRMILRAPHLLLVGSDSCRDGTEDNTDAQAGRGLPARPAAGHRVWSSCLCPAPASAVYPARTRLRYSLFGLLPAAFLALVPATPGQQVYPKSQEDIDWITRSAEPPLDRKGLDDLLAREPNRVYVKVGWPGFSDADLKDVLRMKKLAYLAICNPLPVNFNEKREGIR